MDGDGFLIYKRFANGEKLGLDIMLKRGYSNIADWLFKVGHQMDMRTYLTLVANSQWKEIEVCILNKSYPPQKLVEKSIFDGNYEFVKIMLKHRLLTSLIIREYMSSQHPVENFVGKMGDIKTFELMIQNQILPHSYEYIILHPEYIRVMEKYGIAPFEEPINFISEFYDHLDILAIY